MADVNTENDKDRAKELIKTEEIKEEIVLEKPVESPPIPVVIVEEPEKKKTEIKEIVDTHLETLGLKTNQSWLMKLWQGIQKHGLTYAIILGVGISIGCFITNQMNSNDMKQSINRQRLTYMGDIFDITPSPIKKYYVDNGSFSFFTRKNEVEKEPLKEEPTEKTITKK